MPHESAADTPDESTVRAVLDGATDDRGLILASAAEVAEVVVDGHWIIVVLALETQSNDLLARVHRCLVRALPDANIEVRAGARTYRGGAGFGAERHVIAVLGGKGGVGKSTVAVNLALTLSAMGMSVGLLDGDVNAPDIPHMLGVHATEPPAGLGWQLTSRHPVRPSKRQRPQQRYGIEVMSAGFIMPERFPPRITSRLLVSTLFRYMIFEVAWSAGVLVIDAPPGTGEELQVIAGELPLSGAIFVTTPQDLAQMDAERTLALLTEHGVPVIGLVKNMASMTCPHCQREIDMFGQSARLSDAGVRVIGEIPFDVRLSVTADQGRPLVLGDPRGPIAYEFARIASAWRRWLAERAPAQAAGEN